MKLFFARHGESTANLNWEFSNNKSKHPLTEKGVEQARLLAESLFVELAGQPVECIFTSPVLRALQTAQIVQEHLKVPIETTEALREWSVGIYEGTTDSEGWALHRQVQQDWFFNHKLDSKMPGGESFQDIQMRFVPFIEQLIAHWGDSQRQVILVSHGGIFLSMLPALFKNISYEFAMERSFPYATFALAETRPDGLWCLSWCGEKVAEL